MLCKLLTRECWFLLLKLHSTFMSSLLLPHYFLATSSPFPRHFLRSRASACHRHCLSACLGLDIARRVPPTDCTITPQHHGGRGSSSSDFGDDDDELEFGEPGAGRGNGGQRGHHGHNRPDSAFDASFGPGSSSSLSSQSQSHHNSMPGRGQHSGGHHDRNSNAQDKFYA